MSISQVCKLHSVVAGVLMPINVLLNATVMLETLTTATWLSMTNIMFR